MEKIELLKKEIEEIIANSFSKTDISHSKTTLEWLLKLKPYADEALQIAALSHDIERGRREKSNKTEAEKIKDYDKIKEEHSKRSSKIISELLFKYEFDEKFIKKVKHLVLNHEVGGDEETNILMDADSLSFFQSNLEYYFEKHESESNMTYFKIKYMFDRMSEKSKKLARQFIYENQELNNLFKKVVNT
ncbi:MAG: DUF4202 family protein [Candidatus Woesearchaeota archaeon]|jgi:hypothetical protein